MSKIDNEYSSSVLKKIAILSAKVSSEGREAKTSKILKEKGYNEKIIEAYFKH